MYRECMKALIAKIVLSVAAGILCSSCNTVYGVGKDLENVGSSMQNKAKSGIWGSRPAASEVPDYLDASDDLSLIPYE